MKTSRRAYVVVVTDTQDAIVSVRAFTTLRAATTCQLQYDDKPELAQVFIRRMNDEREEHGWNRK